MRKEGIFFLSFHFSDEFSTFPFSENLKFSLNTFYLQKEEAADLCSRALIAGMHGDNMSGNSFRLVIIEPKQTENRVCVLLYCQEKHPFYSF